MRSTFAAALSFKRSALSAAPVFKPGNSSSSTTWSARGCREREHHGLTQLELRCMPHSVREISGRQGAAWRRRGDIHLLLIEEVYRL
jgi:hypothetical protein